MVEFKACFIKFRDRHETLYRYWAIYHGLFLVSPERTAAFKSEWGHFFLSFVEESIEHQLFLRIAKSIDAIGKANEIPQKDHRTLSLKVLIKMYCEQNGKHVGRVEELLQKLEAHARSIVNFRNKHVSHWDFRHSVDPSHPHLPIRINVLKEALDLITEILNLISADTGLPGPCLDSLAVLNEAQSSMNCAILFKDLRQRALMEKVDGETVLAELKRADIWRV